MQPSKAPGRNGSPCPMSPTRRSPSTSLSRATSAQGGGASNKSIKNMKIVPSSISQYKTLDLATTLGNSLNSMFV